MQQIAERLFSFKNLLVGRVYCIVDTDGLTLIDCGLALATERVLRQLASAGYAPTDVKRILITHGHPDHIGGLPLLKAQTQAQVITSVDERPYVEGKLPVAQPMPEHVPPLARMMMPSKPQTMPGTPIDRTVTAGDILTEVMDGLQVIATPGHSPGHVSYWQPQRRILFTGDVVMRLPWLRLPFAGFTTDMAQNRRSVQSIAQLEPTMICFGHGLPMRENAAAQLKAFAAKAAPTA
jgi:glyoxylase-like metal-dependent hydrolase (beta-lactamase superfamily II)